MLKPALISCALLAMCSPADAVDCSRWPAHAQCLPQQAQPVVKRRIKVIRKIAKKFRREMVTVRRGAPSNGAPHQTGRSEPTARLAPRPAETLMYRQIVPIVVRTVSEPRIIPLPSRMPDFEPRGVVDEAPRPFVPPSISWTRTDDGKIAIVSLVLSFIIGSVAYAFGQSPQGKNHAAAHPARSAQIHQRLSAAINRLGQLGARIGKGAPQPARIEPTFA